jgi:type I restriction enzyme S subunit
MTESSHLPLGHYFTIERGSTYKSAMLGLPGPVLLGLGTIRRHGGFRDDSLTSYGGDCPERMLVSPGGLYASLKDVTQSADLLGAVARLPLNAPSGRLTQDTVKLVPTSASIPIDYLYWVLQTPEYRDYCFEHATGTTTLGLPREDFLAFEVPAPTRDRVALADLLSAIAEKVELNRRMNGTLEATAAALFRSWFVDFDPVVAKAEGRRAVGVSPAMYGALPATLFGEGDDSLPSGWRVGAVRDLASFVNGRNFTSGASGTGRMVIRIAEMGGDARGSTIYNDVVADDDNVARTGDLLFSWSGSLRVDRWYGDEALVNQHIFKVVCSAWPQWFVHHHLLVALPVFQEIAAGKATTMGHIKREHLGQVRVVLPTAEVLANASTVMEPLYARVLSNERENRTLAALRDRLLPQLLSGAIRLRDAERDVAAAV